MSGELTPAHVLTPTGRWAEIFFRALSSRVAIQLQFISFRGSLPGESRGVVDLLSIRLRRGAEFRRKSCVGRPRRAS